MICTLLQLLPSMAEDTLGERALRVTTAVLVVHGCVLLALWIYIKSQEGWDITSGPSWWRAAELVLAPLMTLATLIAGQLIRHPYAAYHNMGASADQPLGASA